jgi:DAK2 domain fusion protein YloV
LTGQQGTSERNTPSIPPGSGSGTRGVLEGEGKPSAAWDGHEFRRGIEASTAWLEAHIDFVNSLNVYPVPDGDTGTNMYLTMQAALREMSTITEDSVSSVAQALAHGALMGARGNSGVILSQVWRGVAKQLDGKMQLTGSDWALALREGASTAYKGVMRPVEGTILTVVREAADAAMRAVAQRDDLSYVFEQTLQQAAATLQHTPDLLPVLKEAGVVDAGGQGLCIVLEGLLRHRRGEKIVVGPRARTAEVDRASIAGEEYGYDIQCLIEGENLPLDTIRDTLMSMGDSVLVVGDSSTIKVHIHSDDPGRVMSYATSQGTLRDVVIENMQDQYKQFLARQEPRPATLAQPASEIAVVAVATGEGLRRVFESLGAGATAPGGQTMNPSTEELLKAISGLPAQQVIILPNNPNVILTAQQAQGMSPKQVVVIQTKTVPQGISALLAFNYQSDLRTNADLMERAAAQIQTIEITNAVRSVHVNGLRIQEGQFIGLLNGELLEAGNELQPVTQAMLQRLDMSGYEIVTVYWGANVTLEEAERLASWIQEHYADKEVELVEGKQPYYHYIISVE